MGERIESNCNEIFGEPWLNRSSYELPNVERTKLADLGEKLKAFALPYIDQLRLVPTKFHRGPQYVDLSEQRDWLEKDVLKPIAKLREALREDRRHYFKGAMFDHSPFEVNFDKTIRVLNELEDYAEAAFTEIDQQVTLGIQNTSQIQFEIVNGIVEIINSELDILQTRGMSERVKVLVRLAFKEITGFDKHLDDDVKVAVKRAKK